MLCQRTVGPQLTGHRDKKLSLLKPRYQKKTTVYLNFSWKSIHSIYTFPFTWNSMVRFLSESDGWTWFGALECLRRVGPMMTPSPGFLCRLPARLLQRVRNSWGSSNPESSRMHSGNAPRRLLWLLLLDRPLPETHRAIINVSVYFRFLVFIATIFLVYRVNTWHHVCQCFQLNQIINLSYMFLLNIISRKKLQLVIIYTV